MDKQKIDKLEQKRQELLEQYRSVVKEIKNEKINGVDFIGKFIIFDETRHIYVRDQMVFDEGVVLAGIFLTTILVNSIFMLMMIIDTISLLRISLTSSKLKIIRK